MKKKFKIGDRVKIQYIDFYAYGTVIALGEGIATVDIDERYKIIPFNLLEIANE